MKTLVFIAYLLTVAYTFDLEKQKAFFENYEECARQLGIQNKQKMDSKALKCVGEKEGLYDEQGAIIKDKCLEYVNKLTPNTNKHQAIEIASNCIDQEYQGSGSNYQKSIAIIECTLQHNITDLLHENH